MEDSPGATAVVDTIHEFCRALDARDWPALRRCLADEVDTDYSSFRGTPPARVAADAFVASRENALAALTTQHLSLNHLVTMEAGGAHCRFDFVIHRWPGEKSDARFYHTYGYYEMVLQPSTGASHGWLICSITQHALRSVGHPEIHGARR